MTDRETVRAGYDALGTTYAEHRSVGTAERALLERALGPSSDPPRLLDAGCGPGPTLAELTDRCRAVGLDLSSKQLRLAARTAPDAALVRGDLAALPFGTDRFDVAVSLGVLMHLPDVEQDAALAEFARVLRPGGRLVVSDGTGAWRGEHDDWLADGVTMSWEITGIDAVLEGLEAVGFERLERTVTTDELAEDDDAGQGLALLELAG
jgi:SAM-dependent methyltransferase